MKNADEFLLTAFESAVDAMRSEAETRKCTKTFGAALERAETNFVKYLRRERRRSQKKHTQGSNKRIKQKTKCFRLTDEESDFLRKNAYFLGYRTSAEYIRQRCCKRPRR